jgi:WhiB family redox-sensing transcriptional regulator
MSWREKAQCRGHDPETWFPLPLDHETRAAAVSICGTCPVTRQCGELAEMHRSSSGIFAGRDWGLEPWRPDRVEVAS